MPNGTRLESCTRLAIAALAGLTIAGPLFPSTPNLPR